MRVSPVIVAVCLAASLLGIPARAQQAAPQAPANDDCLGCHGDSSAVRADGRPVAVKPELFGESIHGQAGVACVDCHTDLATATEWPHAEKLAPATCATCHAPAVEEWGRSVHAARVGGSGTVAAQCGGCHGTHDIRPVADPESRVYHLSLPRTCGSCHGAAERLSGQEPAAPAVFRHFQDSIHGQALTRAGLVVAPACSDCHGSHLILRHTDPESQVFHARVPATCGRCHEGIEKGYTEGVHGTALEAGNPLAPVCSTCHSAHDIARADLQSWRLQVVTECGTCHPQSVQTYRDTYHGQVTSLGFVRVATCSDCHGAHAVFPKADPRSTVAPANVVETCGTCHAGASQGFAQYDPHADRHDHARNPLLYYAGRFMDSLLIFVFGFFGLHTGLWFVRELRHRRRHHLASDRAGTAGQTDTETTDADDAE